MIDTRKLQIGNKIKWKKENEPSFNKKGFITGIKKNKVEIDNKHNIHKRNAEGISLTENYAAFFKENGFIKKHNRYKDLDYYEHPKFGLVFVNDDEKMGFAVCTLYDGIEFLRKGYNIYHIHDVQNIFSSLKVGLELK